MILLFMEFINRIKSKKIGYRYICLLFCIILLSYCKTSNVTNNNDDSDGLKIEIIFEGTNSAVGIVYVSWIENENGDNIQNIYVCRKIANNSLLGTPLPYWNKEKRTGTDVDGATGATQNNNFTLLKNLTISDRKFRVYFEIDRSRNGNTYFNDRPSITFCTELIDLDNLQTEYHMERTGWMSNDTASPTHYSQQPIQPIPGFAQFKYMEDLLYILPLNDMVNNIKVRIK